MWLHIPGIGVSVISFNSSISLRSSFSPAPFVCLTLSTPPPPLSLPTCSLIPAYTCALPPRSAHAPRQTSSPSQNMVNPYVVFRTESGPLSEVGWSHKSIRGFIWCLTTNTRLLDQLDFMSYRCLSSIFQSICTWERTILCQLLQTYYGTFPAVSVSIYCKKNHVISTAEFLRHVLPPVCSTQTPPVAWKVQTFSSAGQSPAASLYRRKTNSRKYPDPIFWTFSSACLKMSFAGSVTTD